MPRGDQLEAGFEQQLLGERSPDLDLGTALLAFARQLLRCERCAVDAVAAGARADREEDVADAVGCGLDQLLLLQYADAHGVDERVARITGREIDLATERGHADAVAIVADAAHHAREQIAITCLIQRAESKAIEQGDGARSHREDVAQNPAGPRGGPLIGLDGGWVVMRFDLERDRPAIGEPQHAGVLAGSLDDLWSRRGKCLEDRPRVLVGAVLAPQGGEDAQLGERGRPAEHGFDACVLFGCEVVLLHQLGGDLRICHFRVTPFATARNTRARTLGAEVFISASASPASNHTPWQCVHWSIWMPSQSCVMRSYPHLGHFMWCFLRSLSAAACCAAARCCRSSSASRR